MYFRVNKGKYILYWDFWIMLGKKNNYILLVPFIKRLTKRDSINIHMPRLEEENQFYLDVYQQVYNTEGSAGWQKLPCD